MPDVFSGLAFLSAFLLLYDGDISMERTIVLSVILSVSVGCHLSNVLSIGSTLLVVAVFRAFRGTQQFWPNRSIKGIARFVLLPTALILCAICMSNYRSGFGFKLSAGSSTFLLNRLFESGLAEYYLEAQCKVEQLTPCKYLHNLPKGSDFLWGSHPLLKEMGGWGGAGSQAGKIVFGTIRRYPIRFAIECARQTLREFVIFDPEGENRPIRNEFTSKVFEELYPGDFPKYIRTKQWSGRLSWAAQKLYRLYKAVFWICLCACIVQLIRGRRSGKANNLLALTMVYLVANACVTGSLSGTYDRYQTRINWLMTLCFAAYVLPIVADRWNLDRE